jgi:putative transposase
MNTPRSHRVAEYSAPTPRRLDQRIRKSRLTKDSPGCEAAGQPSWPGIDTFQLLRRLYALIFIEHGTRRLPIAGVTANPTGSRVAQRARNLAMDLGARMDTLRFVIRDRDSKYTLAFDGVFDTESIQVIKTPPQAPRANAICESVVGTLRRELLDRILILGPGHLRRVLAEYAIHYHAHRPHQSLRQRFPDTGPAVPAPLIDLTGSRIKRRPVLGGLINEYEAA